MEKLKEKEDKSNKRLKHQTLEKYLRKQIFVTEMKVKVVI